MTIGCNVLLVLNALFLLGRCQPAESQWNFDIEGTCWDPRVLVIYAIVTGGELRCLSDGASCADMVCSLLRLHRLLPGGLSRLHPLPASDEEEEEDRPDDRSWHW